MRFLFSLLLLCLVGVVSSAQTSSENEQKPAPVKETVVVTGTYDPVPLEEVDRAVSAFSIGSTPELYRSFADLLQFQPSIDLRQRGPNGVQGDLSIRGSSFGQTLVLVNGLRMNDAQTGHHNLDLPLPLESLDRVEVMRGAGSALYGSDAVGGTVNFITAEPTRSEIRVGSEVGNFGTNAQRAEFVVSQKAIGQRLTLQRDFSSGFRADRDYRNLLGASDTRIRTRFGVTNFLLGASDRAFGADQFYGNYNSWERTKGWFASVRQEFGEKTEAALGYRRHTDEFVLRRDRPSLYKNVHETESWQAALRRRDGLSQNITLFSGVEAYRDSIQSSNLGRHARNRGAAYLGLDLRALKRASLSVGAREEFYGSLRTQFSPTVSGAFWVVPSLRLRASASRAFRLPTYTDLYYRDPANVGNPQLRPESAWSYEGGVQWTKGHLVGEATVFHRREHDVIDYFRYSPTDVWKATNIQRLNFTGLELAVGARLPREQQVQLSYTLLHGAQEALNGAFSRYVFNYPSNNAVASWTGRLPGRVLARTRIGATQRYARDAYAVWDAGLSREIGYAVAHVKASNLSNTSYQEILGVAMPGRSFTVGLDFVFPRGKR